jgi:acetyltransferase EpsM
VKELVIWGASGHALVVADIIRLEGKYHIFGFLDDVNSARWGQPFCGASVLGGQDQLAFLQQKGIQNLILAFGHCEARLAKGALAKKEGFVLVRAVHPRATVASDVSIGEGAVIAAGAVLNPGTKLGESVIVNTCASVDHECVIEDGVHICPGAHLAGRVTVKRGSWVGIGAVVKEGVEIGVGSVIGAGAVVLENVPTGVVAFGNPCRPMKKVKS